MPLIHCSGRRILFAHVPKTGGSSVEDYLQRRFGPLDLLDAGHDARGLQTGMLSPPQHLTAAELDRCLGPVDASFAVVRDPVARIVSEYRFQSGASFVARLGFGLWLRAVLLAARREPRIHDNHIRPQDDLVPAGAEIFRLEDGFGPLTAWLDAQAGTAAPGLSVGRLLGSTAPRPRPGRPDLRLIARFYAADYARFGYEPPDGRKHPQDPLAGLKDLLARPLAWLLVRRQRRAWLSPGRNAGRDR